MKFNKKLIIISFFITFFIFLGLNVRVSSNEDTWSRRWNNRIEYGIDIAIDSQDDIYVVGMTTNSEDNSDDICLLKYNENGDLIWDNIWNKETNEYEIPIAIDKSENVYIAGTKWNLTTYNKDVFLIKYDSEGKIKWNQTWESPNIEECCGLVIDSLNNGYIAGTTEYFGESYSDIFIIKFNSSGSILWNITWGTSEDTFLNAITIDSLNNFYIAVEFLHETFLVKFDSSGTELWNITLHDDIYFQDLTTDFEDNIIYATEYRLQKFNNSGDMIWTHNLTNKQTFGLNLATDSNGNIFIAENRINPCPPGNFFFGPMAGCICSAIYLEKYNSSGHFIWEKKCTGCTDAQTGGIALDSLNNIYLCGTLVSGQGCERIFDIILIKNPKHFSGLCIPIYYDLLALFILIPSSIITFLVYKYHKKWKLRKKD